MPLCSLWPVTSGPLSCQTTGYRFWKWFRGKVGNRWSRQDNHKTIFLEGLFVTATFTQIIELRYKQRRIILDCCRRCEMIRCHTRWQLQTVLRPTILELYSRDSDDQGHLRYGLVISELVIIDWPVHRQPGWCVQRVQYICVSRKHIRRLFNVFYSVDITLALNGGFIFCDIYREKYFWSLRGVHWSFCCHPIFTRTTHKRYTSIENAKQWTTFILFTVIGLIMILV